MNKEELRQFIIEANKAGYAGGEQKQWIKEKDGSTTIVFEKGDWSSHDNFFGGEPYGGRTVVSFKEKPVWIMVYYGFVEERAATEAVYKLLRGALMKMPENFPFRGPKEYKEGEYIYLNFWEGELKRFYGEEKIEKGGNLAYKANYMGGLVDKRQGV